MRVSKNQVTLLSATVAALFAGAANAQVVWPSTGVPGTPGLTFARELVASTVIAPNATATGVLGIGLPGGQDRYIRISLTNAVFNSAPAGADLVATPAMASTVVASGGGAGASSVIFQVTAASAGNAIANPVVFTLPTGVNITSTASNATITYDVYEFLTQAQAGTPVLYSRTQTLAGFAPTFTLARVGASQDTTATAASSFTTMSGGAVNSGTGGLRTTISNTALTLNTLATANPAPCAGPQPCLANGTTQATIAAIANTASTANVLTLTGDFSAAASAASINTANGTAEAASAVTATTATLPLLTNSAAGTMTVRYTVNGTTALPVSTYSTSGTFVANAGYAIPTLSAGNTGSIGRDGSQFESPWVTTTPGFISRFFITQTNSTTIPYTVTVRNASGVCVGCATGLTLAPGRQNVVTLASLLPADTTAFPGPYQVTFNFSALAGSVQGTYALTSPNGSVTVQRLYTLGFQ